MANRKSLLVPNARAALEQLKFEIAQELGIELPADGYYGHMTTRDMGSIGGTITKRLIQMAEQQISRRY
ncbi:alpha/beta-type small acid-soluble spore protein [Paenibacillus sp. ATY16]|uniref:alpha/beta-type small acid-soluble spore protein n=1 Tax=Paenibacillus sp. ATY16 TaxID=1759312 RepID=UPI00200BBB52|nr:alpha/beta-type small acid-soluble spore protein [Paenibacillus sp. ATY16]MCK9860165.1 alpha/beta-type small acid-soluble spore protein [Paenibacillus sp. ATY16]